MITANDLISGHEHLHIEIMYREGVFSGCCDAPIYDNSDICSKCGNHTEIMMTCPECDGVTEFIERTGNLSKPNGWVYIQCGLCNGIGRIETEYKPIPFENV